MTFDGSLNGLVGTFKSTGIRTRIVDGSLVTECFNGDGGIVSAQALKAGHEQMGEEIRLWPYIDQAFLQ